MPRYYQLRIIKKIKFFKEYSKLCKEAFKERHANYMRKLWKTKSGRKLVDKARKELKYSKNTANADIFILLMNTYWDLKEDKII